MIKLTKLRTINGKVQEKTMLEWVKASKKKLSRVSEERDYDPRKKKQSREIGTDYKEESC